MAKFDIKTEAAKGLYAGAGAADLAIQTVKVYVSEAQKRIESAQKETQKAIASAQRSVQGFEFRPLALPGQATTVVTSTVDELSKDAKARRAAIEKRVAELQTEAQKLVSTNVETYDELVKRGETVVKRLRKETSSTVDPGPVKKITGVTTTAKKAPARKTTAKKAPAKKSTAKKAPAKKTATRKVSAAKA
jgi:hypothetical protein